jgi:hypothetical protein
MLFIAASAAGLISHEGLPGWGDSEAGIEDQARGHRDCLLPLDESGDGSTKISLKDKAKMLAFMIARNRPRKLSNQYERAHGLQDREWRVIAQSSREIALGRAALEAGGQRQGGEEVRFVDVCASEPESLGIFDGEMIAPRKNRSRDDQSAHRPNEARRGGQPGVRISGIHARLCRRCRGSPESQGVQDRVRNESQCLIIQRRPADPEQFRADLGGGCYGHRLLPWKKLPTYRAVEKCLRKALSEIEAIKATTQSPGDTSASVLLALNEGLAKADLRKIVLRKKITPQQAHRRVKADGFRINGNIFLKPDRLKHWLPSQRERTILKDAGVLRTRRGDTATVEQVIAGIPGKPRYYVLDVEKLEQLLRKSRGDSRR